MADVEELPVVEEPTVLVRGGPGVDGRGIQSDEGTEASITSTGLGTRNRSLTQRKQARDVFACWLLR